MKRNNRFMHFQFDYSFCSDTVQFKAVSIGDFKLETVLFAAFLILSFSLLMFFISSCASSVEEPKEVYAPLDYTEEDVRENEKDRILKLNTQNPVKALWLATFLGNDEVTALCRDNCIEVYKKSIDDKDYFDAYNVYRSLLAAGVKIDEYAGIDGKNLSEIYNVDVPGLNAPPKEQLPKNIADCINATVTVWVDRGLSIKDGVAYADRAIGSGFFISRNGYIVTNHHVIADVVDPKNEKYMKVYVKLASDTDTRIPAKIVGWDSVIDLALLKVEVDAPFVLQLGSSADLSVGDKVSAIGTPLGLDGTLTQGIVSAVGRKLFTTGSVLQIDAAVNQGNSGGPLIDGQMRVQAIVFAGMLQYQGLNFAIPVEYLRQDLPILFHGGERPYPWTGSYGHTKRGSNNRVINALDVQYVMPGGSSSVAGLKDADAITALDGHKVVSIESMQDILRDYVPGTIVNVECERGDVKQHRLVYLEARPKNPGYAIYKSDLLTGSLIPLIGMALLPSSTLSKKTYTIARIISGSAADESGFSENDPVTVSNVRFNNDKSAAYIEIATKRQKKGYLDLQLGLPVMLDGPYYF